MTSWKTSTAPDGGFPGSGVPRTDKLRDRPRIPVSRWGKASSAWKASGRESRERLLDGVLNLRTADQFGNQTANRPGIKTKKGIGAGVGEQETIAGIDGNHRLGHGAENHS